MGVLNRIVEWATELPDWQSDAVRRIFIKGDLNETDRKELLAILKKTKGIEDPNNPAPSPITLKASDVPSTSASQGVVILKSMYGVKNVNALAPDQTLKFALKGVTVVYGDTASGKSGYCRVLKKACRARGQVEEILPDVFTTYDQDIVAEALFDISIDGQDRTERWIDKQPAPDSLSNIAVFDSETDRFYVGDRHDLIYIPYGMDVFKKLGDLCKSSKEQLEIELPQIDPLPKILTDLVPTTAVGQLIQSLTHETNPSEVEKLAKFTEAELERLEYLRKLRAQIDANRPEVLAAQHRRSKSRIEKIRDGVIALDNGLSPEKLNNLRLLQIRAREATETARLASEEAFKNQPLPGVGSDPWREMFEAARQYSETIAYAGQPFPFTDTDSRCVLCQQLLEDEAKQRMQSFEKFIKQDTARQAEIAEITLKQEWDSFCSLQFHPESAEPEIIEEIGDDDPDCKKTLLEYLESVSKLAANIRQNYEKGEWGEILSLNPTPTPLLQALADSKEIKAKELDATTQTKDQQGLRNEFDELNARKVFSDYKDHVLNHINKQIHRHRIQQCIDDTDTQAISLRSTQIMNDAVTGDLRKNLMEELQFLGLNIKLTLVPETRKGTTSQYLKLDTATLKNVAVSSVLSEGERRAVAIASLLAEVKGVSHYYGLVFDDPVSSLDHIWRHRVAKRLVREGAKRQVIIFTHDIVFLFAIQNECDEQLVPITTSTLQCSNMGTGICYLDDVPWLAKKVGKRVEHLLSRCQEADKENFTKDNDKYRAFSEECYGSLRECWERAVEEVLFNQVVQRFDTDIKTLRLNGVSVEHEDYKTIYYAMKKCSEAVHDMAAAVNKPAPPLEELKQDIKSLKTFVDEIKKRRTNLMKERKRLLKAPDAEIC